MESQGFNIVVTGEPGTGRSTAIREHLQTVAAGKPSPDEWVYVNNFTDAYKPVALRLPPGKGTRLRPLDCGDDRRGARAHPAHLRLRRLRAPP